MRNHSDVWLWDKSTLHLYTCIVCNVTYSVYHLYNVQFLQSTWTTRPWNSTYLSKADTDTGKTCSFVVFENNERIEEKKTQIETVNFSVLTLKCFKKFMFTMAHQTIETSNVFPKNESILTYKTIHHSCFPNWANPQLTPESRESWRFC